MSSINWGLITRLADALVPADEFPSASQSGIVQALARDSVGRMAELWSQLLTPGLMCLDLESASRFEITASELDEAGFNELVGCVEAGDVQADWNVDPAEFFTALVRLVVTEYYGARGSPAWSMVGFDPSIKRRSRDGGLARLPTIDLAGARTEYDVIVIGLGAGGGVSASVLAEHGASVLGVERGTELSFEEVGNDHLATWRLPIKGLPVPPGAEAGPRVVSSGDSTRVITNPADPLWSPLPQTIGGGTRIYQGMAWRMVPDDFRMASLYGVPEGSSLADWPISYDELEPFYSEAEQRIGVSGDGNRHRVQGARSCDYPMPQLIDDNPEMRVLARGAERLGWSTGPVPMLVNSTVREGRGACGRCGECLGFACPTESKNSPYNTVLPKAVATGRLDILDRTMAVEITTDRHGVVDGVRLHRDGRTRVVRAKHVVVAAAAIETARLLLASTSPQHPHGLGNEHDQVGRHLQGHLYVGAFGSFSEQVIDSRGPNVSIATCDFLHGNPGIIGGGVLANEVLKLPAIHWDWALPPDAPRYGAAGKRTMKELYSRTSHVYGPIQEIPSPSARVILSPTVRDAVGLPVAHLSGELHPANRAVADFLIQQATTWLEASGAQRTWSAPYDLRLTGGVHQAGTARMGEDPHNSVTDRWGRVHGHRNLWVADGSVHVTNGGVNPVLTILALSFRQSHHLANQI